MDEKRSEFVTMRIIIIIYCIYIAQFQIFSHYTIQNVSDMKINIEKRRLIHQVLALFFPGRQLIGCESLIDCESLREQVNQPDIRWY